MCNKINLIYERVIAINECYQHLDFDLFDLMQLIEFIITFSIPEMK